MIRIRRPDDMHVHLRDGYMLKKMVPHTAKQFGTALVMPNTTKPILTGEDATRYRKEIEGLAGGGFVPMMTIKLTEKTTKRMIEEASEADVVAAKLYPEGVTTNSQDGIRSTESLYPVFETMERRHIVLSIHGETPGVFTMDREAHYLETLSEIARTFPNLRIVLEHVTTAAAVDLVLHLPGTVAATITVHHLYLTLDDVIGGMLRPHFFCKPVAKRPEDRARLREAATSGNPKFFLGTDSAPHLQSNKECASGCAGVFTAPVAMSCLAELFEETPNFPSALEAFTSTHGDRFYGIDPSLDKIELVRKPWTVPSDYDGVVPFRAGETLAWQVA